ncbi:hypothetical protein [Halomonas sp. WWR20]
MDEREKLRKFRELDDAFAQALRDMEQTTSHQKPEAEQQRQVSFEERLNDLMTEYRLPNENVTTLLRTLIELEKIA